MWTFIQRYRPAIPRKIKENDNTQGSSVTDKDFERKDRDGALNYVPLALVLMDLPSDCWSCLVAKGKPDHFCEKSVPGHPAFDVF